MRQGAEARTQSQDQYTKHQGQHRGQEQHKGCEHCKGHEHHEGQEHYKGCSLKFKWEEEYNNWEEYQM